MKKPNTVSTDQKRGKSTKVKPKSPKLREVKILLDEDLVIVTGGLGPTPTMADEG